MTPFRWTSDETLIRWHRRANLWFKVPIIIAFTIIAPLIFGLESVRKPLGIFGLILITPALPASILCQWAWREAERRDLDPLRHAEDIGWFG